MTSTQLFLAALPFFSFFLVASITPGPNNFMVAASGMNYGYKRTLPHIAGVVTGFCSLLLLCMLGIGAVFELFPALKIILKVFAAAYLLYLACKMAKAALAKPDAGEQVEEDAKKPRPLSFIEAAMFQYINPKAWVMGISSTATFLPAGAMLEEKAAIILLSVLFISIPCIMSWTLFGKAMSLLFTSDRYRRFVNLTLALLLVATIPMLVL